MGQLQVENKLLKNQNRKFRDQTDFQDRLKIRNYAIKEDENNSNYDENLLNFFSSNNKDL